MFYLQNVKILEKEEIIDKIYTLLIFRILPILLINIYKQQISDFNENL